MSDISNLQKEVLAFRDARDWAQFHNSKDLSIGLSIEANELLEQFLWKKSTEGNPLNIKEELADVMIYALLIAHEQNIDIAEAIREKLRKNAAKYPIDKAKGKSTKYDQL